MRRSASEIIRSLESRIARLEKSSAPKGKGQIAIMERLQVMGIGEHYFNDVVSGLRVNYGSLQSAAKALHNKGLVKVDNPNVPLMIQLTEKGEQMRVARLEKSSSLRGGIKVHVVDATNYTPLHDYKTQISSASDLFNLIKDVEKKINVILEEDDEVISVDKKTHLSYGGDANYLIFEVGVNHERLDEDGRKIRDFLSYHIEIKDAGVALLILDNPKLFKDMRKRNY